jgi:hypothetical protein
MARDRTATDALGPVAYIEFFRPELVEGGIHIDRVPQNDGVDDQAKGADFPGRRGNAGAARRACRGRQRGPTRNDPRHG